ncbi:MAG: PqqD family protein [Thermomicrobiales bacterium]|nr:PqqD family protein [Thermomicrobiales bacterium]
MSISGQWNGNDDTWVHQYADAVPAARSLSEFCIERVGNDVVLFDGMLARYHTLNNLAFDIWRCCDGERSIARMGSVLEQNDVRPEVIAAAVTQLGEAGLLQASEAVFEATVSRRLLMKLAAAGVIGAVGMPIIVSITSPEPASADSPRCLTKGEKGCGGRTNPYQCCPGLSCQSACLGCSDTVCQ